MLKTTAYYRTEDVLENFKIKINIRELSRLQNTPTNEHRKNLKQYDKELIISWQEKLYSPKDIANYIKKKEIYGCGKPYQVIKEGEGYKVTICDYI